jgi:glucosylceramidase
MYINDLKQLRDQWPNKGMIHTESSIDIDSKDPIGQYWRESKDYAGEFIPFNSYAYDIINNLNCGTQGYIEWCMILSNEGKPNPYDNFNSAPVLINPETHKVTYTPLYYLLSHFSKFIRPDALRIFAKGENDSDLIYTAAKNVDNSIVLILYNKNEDLYDINISIKSETYQVNLGPKTMQTIYLH